MTDLQIAITAGAAIVVLWIIGINIREWRALRQRLSATAVVVDEPMFSVPTERLVEHVVPSTISESIATLRWQTPMAVTRIQQELRGWRHVGSKPIYFAWQRSADEMAVAEAGEGSVVGLQVGVLLATRSGPIHAMEYSEWQEALGRIARSLGAQLDIPSMNDVLSKARQLDQQCAAVDAQLTLAITAAQVLSATAIASAAHAAGLEARGDARFAMGPLHHQRFSVFPGQNGNTIVLLLDAPRTRSPEQAFDEMLECAQRMAALLTADVTDESGRLLTATDIEQIRQQVVQRAQALAQLGITPGESIAQRLFL